MDVSWNLNQYCLYPFRVSLLGLNVQTNCSVSFFLTQFKFKIQLKIEALQDVTYVVWRIG